MKKYLFILVVLLLVSCAELPEGEYIVQPVGRTVTPQIYEQSGYKVFYGLTPTLEPSVTPTQFPSKTATFTPIPTTLPPTVTITPTPDIVGCFGTIFVTKLNVRDNPQTGNIVGSLVNGTRVMITSIQYIDVSSTRTDEWVGIVYGPLTGYAAAYFNNQKYIEYELSDACYRMRFPEVAIGWHSTIPQIDYTDLENSLRVLSSNRHRVVVKGVDDLRSVLLAVQYGGIGIFRTVRAGDSPNRQLDPKVSALQRYNAQKTFLPPPSSGVWIEPDNETGLINDPVWANIYLAEIIRLFSEDGYTVVFGTEGPGWWNEDQVRALSLTWETARKYKACLGYHAYGVTPNNPVSTSGEWLGFRHRKIHAWLSAIGYGDIPLCGTEVGTGTGDEPFNIQDFVAYNRAIVNDKYLILTSWWTAGVWKNTTTNGRMEEASRALD